MKFTDEHGKVTEVFAKAGEARWFAPFKPTLENVGDTAYNAVYVGVKGARAVVSERDPMQLDPVTQDIVAALVAAPRE